MTKFGCSMNYLIKRICGSETKYRLSFGSKTIRQNDIPNVIIETLKRYAQNKMFFLGQYPRNLSVVYLPQFLT